MRSTPLSHDSRHRNPSIPAVITPTKRLLPSERAALGQSRLATSGLAPVNALAHALIPCPIVLDLQDLRAALADDDCVGVREDGGDGEASGALDVHEEGAGSGHEGLELVLAGLTRHLLVAGRGRRGGKCAYAAGEGLRRSTARTWSLVSSKSSSRHLGRKARRREVANSRCSGELRESRVPAHRPLSRAPKCPRWLKLTILTVYGESLGLVDCR